MFLTYTKNGNYVRYFLISLIVIISQYIHISNHHINTFNMYIFFVHYTLIKLKKKKKPNIMKKEMLLSFYLKYYGRILPLVVV